MKVNWPERVWINSPVRLLVQKRETRFFKQMRDMTPGAHALEIGCGRGVGARLILDSFNLGRVDALDIDLRMIRLASRKHSIQNRNCLLFYVADAQHLPYADGCLDAVFNFGIIHHLEDWEQGVREIARVLKPDGGFYFEEIYPPLYANFLFRHLLDHPTENRFHGPEFCAALSQAGLKLLPGYRQSRFGVLGVAVKERS
jgi:ubiquinone/menaquinone biosynthesis C-methylase UbiE